jgi:hypothetical protein
MPGAFFGVDMFASLVSVEVEVGCVLLRSGKESFSHLPPA